MTRMESALVLRLGSDLREALERAAAADQRSLANYARMALAEHLRNAGYLADKGTTKPKGRKEK